MTLKVLHTPYWTHTNQPEWRSHIESLFPVASYFQNHFASFPNLQHAMQGREKGAGRGGEMTVSINTATWCMNNLAGRGGSSKCATTTISVLLAVKPVNSFSSITMVTREWSQSMVLTVVRYQTALNNVLDQRKRERKKRDRERGGKRERKVGRQTVD